MPRKRDIVIAALMRQQQEQEQLMAIAIDNVAKPYRENIAKIQLAMKQYKELNNIGIDHDDIKPSNVIPIKVTEKTYNAYVGKKRGRKTVNRFIEHVAYPLDGTIWEKFVFVIKKAGRFISMAEVAKLVKEFEPHLSEIAIKEKFGKHTAKFKDRGYITSVQVNGNQLNTFYGLPEWLIEGKIAEGRGYSMDAVLYKKDQFINSIFD